MPGHGFGVVGITNAAGFEAAFIAMAAVVAFLLVVAIGHSMRLARMQRRWQHLLEGVDAVNVERMLVDHLRSRLELEQRLEEVVKQVRDLDRRMGDAVRFVGIVRFDAFPDVGGAQSFALAIFDEHQNGAVITSLVGRTDCRVYCKNLSRGVCERAMTPEEEEAVRAARAEVAPV